MNLRWLMLSSLALAAVLVQADAVDDWAKAQVEKKHIPGMVIGVYRHGRPIKVGAYGYADLENGAKVQKNSIFEICSITKQFTAAGVLLLQEDGKLQLSDPVSKHIADWPKAWSSVTLPDLLTHTSGLNDENFDFDKPDYKEVVKSMAANIIVPPGEVWEYSNFGYLTLGRIIEKASGKSYYSFLQERIFDRLGMKDTHAKSKSTLTPRRVRGYGWNGKAYVNRDWLTAEVGLGDGGLLSTVEDLNKWSEALKHDKLLKPASRALMLTPGRLKSGELGWPDGMGFGYGLGVFLDGPANHRVEKHSGGWQDASAQLTRYLDDDLTVVVLTNYGGWAERPWVGQAIAHLFDPKLELPTYETAVDPEPAKLELYRKAVSEMVAKRVPKDLLSVRLATFFGPAIEDVAASLKDAKTADLEFVRKVPQGKGAIYLYRHEVPTPEIVFVRFDESGKIANFDSFPIP